MATTPSCPDGKPTGLGAVIRQATGWTLVADATQQGRQCARTKAKETKKHCRRLVFKLRACSLHCGCPPCLKRQEDKQDTTEKGKKSKAKDDFMNCKIKGDTQGLPPYF